MAFSVRLIVFGQHIVSRRCLSAHNTRLVSEVIGRTFNTLSAKTCLKSNKCLLQFGPNRWPLRPELIRHMKTDPNRIYQLHSRSRNKDVVLYATAFVLLVLGGTYASVPLYRIYCQTTGKGGKPFIDEKAAEKIVAMKRAEDRLITVTFSAETTSQMSWNFKPTQPEIKCYPGETVLAFFTAKNPLDRPVDGIATYTVQPFEAGTYLNKIQCFCFEEQRLNPQELVDLPVFFYIDPEYANDPKLESVDDVVLSYTFFEAKKGLTLPTFFNQSTKPKPNDQSVAAIA